jgi:hypothetical protein
MKREPNNLINGNFKIISDFEDKLNDINPVINFKQELKPALKL